MKKRVGYTDAKEEGEGERMKRDYMNSLEKE